MVWWDGEVVISVVMWCVRLSCDVWGCDVICEVVTWCGGCHAMGRMWWVGCHVMWRLSCDGYVVMWCGGCLVMCEAVMWCWGCTLCGGCHVMLRLSFVWRLSCDVTKAGMLVFWGFPMDQDVNLCPTRRKGNKPTIPIFKLSQTSHPFYTTFCFPLNI